MIRLLVAALALLIVPAAVQAKGWPPRDECGGVEGAQDWRRIFATAVANRDADMLLPLFAEDVLLDFGGGSGHETLRERLDPPPYMLWFELEEMLRLGCAASDDGGFVLPWYWSVDIPEVDGMAGLVVTGEDVPLLAEPVSTARVVAQLDWEAAEMDGDWDMTEYYQPVKLPDGRRGYVRQDRLRSLIAHRMIVERVDGKLLATAFVAGD